ncbi:MAG: ferrous iron transport protein A [Clostridia bacterium]|nr:ferrous iron transport protein A [Clostridia bacterium]
MPLALAPEGQELRVIKVLTDDKTKKHLESLGITISSILVILARDGDNIICGIKDGRIVLDRTLAAKILVS